MAPVPALSSLDMTFPIAGMFKAVGSDASSSVRDSCRESAATGATASATAASMMTAAAAARRSLKTVTADSADGGGGRGSPPPRRKQSSRQRRPPRLRLWRCDHPGCTQACAKKYNLDNHKRKHTGELKYQCRVCATRFLWHSGLRTHHVRGRCRGWGATGGGGAAPPATAFPLVAPVPRAPPPGVAAGGHLRRIAPPAAGGVATGGPRPPSPSPLEGRGAEDAGAHLSSAIGWGGLLAAVADADVSSLPSLSVCGEGDNSRGGCGDGRGRGGGDGGGGSGGGGGGGGGCGNSAGGVVPSTKAVAGLPLASAWASGWQPAAVGATTADWVSPPPSSSAEPAASGRESWSSALGLYGPPPAQSPGVPAAITPPAAGCTAPLAGVPAPPLAEWPLLDNSSLAAAVGAISLPAPTGSNASAAANVVPAVAAVDEIAGAAAAPSSVATAAAAPGSATVAAARRAAAAALAAAAVAATAVDDGEWEVVPPSALLA
ncbi:hypothetical protein MMPV_000264 [Pyropia vietnamensis]